MWKGNVSDGLIGKETESKKICAILRFLCEKTFQN